VDSHIKKGAHIIKGAHIKKGANKVEAHKRKLINIENIKLVNYN